MAQTKATKIDGSALQDAFHYALAACGGEALGYESAFARAIGKGQRHVAGAANSRTTYLRLAFRKTREAFGYSPTGAARTLANAPRLAQWILEKAKAAGYDANGGVPLCAVCKTEQAEHGCEGLCYRCKTREADGKPVTATLPPHAAPIVLEQRVNLSEGDLSNLLHALDRLIDDTQEQAADPTQTNARALLALKLAEYASLRQTLTDAYLSI